MKTYRYITINNTVCNTYFHLGGLVQYKVVSYTEKKRKKICLTHSPIRGIRLVLNLTPPRTNVKIILKYLETK